MYKLSAVFIGILISIMVSFNGSLSSKLDNSSSILIIHIVGVLIVGTIMLIKRQKVSFKEHIPLYLFTGGAIGVIMTLFNNLCINSLGVSLTLSIGLFGQSVAATIIDHFGLLGMEVHKVKLKKVFGFAIILCGIVLMMIY